MQRHRCTRSLKEGSSVRCFRTDVNHPIADTWVCGPMRNQTPVHEPALVSALLTDNHRNVGGSLGGDVKAGRVLWQNAVKVPANPDVTELKCSCESWWEHVSAYPPETVLFTALPMLCISSPMPRIVAHPSDAKTTKRNAQRSNLFFFIFTSGVL